MVWLFIALYVLVGGFLAHLIARGERAPGDFTPFHGLVVILFWPVFFLIAIVVAIASALSGKD